MNGFSSRALEIFEAVIQLTATERDTYLTRACAGDSILLQHVKILLRAHDRVGDFLENSPAVSGRELRPTIPAGEKPGDRIGRYKLLQQIGEGGCGVVYMAEQEEPLRRRVALKIIKPGMDTKSVIARFEAERQALALMDHPSIAKVFDAGATESGRPYFVMELVEGLKITDYSDQNSLTTEQRLKLFAQVCRAVQHAHQKGIIHRDLKPSNILVTRNEDGSPSPKVIDFGIAKATTGQRLTDKPVFTAFEMLIGTPAYMSPEQAALSGEDVDTRTDIYSLGVLLYELLTGSTPFSAGELLKIGIDEIRRVIREQEPNRPSTSLSKLKQGDITAVAQYRRSEPATLIRTVRGDLDWIAMKALEKERTRRYETANGLALDIQRYLAREPISARPPSKFYKFQKTVLRNQLLFLSIGAFVLLLIISLVAVSKSLAQERQSRREAEAASVKSRQVTKFLEEMLNGVGPSVALGRDTTMLREILDRTSERVGTDLGDQPAVEAELRSLIGTLYRRIGLYDEAEAMHSAALMIHRELFGNGSAQVAASLNDLGLVHMAQGKAFAAEPLNVEALAIRRRLFGNGHPEVATSLNDLANVLRQRGSLDRAEAMAQEALNIRRKLFGDEHLEVADSLRTLVIISGDEAKWEKAEELAREVLALRRKLLGPEHPWVAAALADLAWATGALGKLGEAESLEREALAMRQKLLGSEHPDVAKSLYLLGDRMRQNRNTREAQPVLSAALSIQRKLLGEGDPALLDTLSSLALTLQAEGKLAEAEAFDREALAAWRKRAGDDDPQTLYAARRLGLTLEAQKKWPEAAAIHRDALALWRKRAGDHDPQTLYTMNRLGWSLESGGQLQDAEAAYREAMLSWRQQARHEDRHTVAETENLARVLKAQKKFLEAEQLLDEAITDNVAREPSHRHLLQARMDLKARREQWKEAAADAALALEHHASYHPSFPIVAALHLKAGNSVAYEQLCAELLAEFGNTLDIYVADQVAKACLFRPSAGVDPQVVGRMADAVVTQGRGDRGALPFFEATKALSEYRLGRYSEAVEWALKPLSASGIYPHGHANAVGAMANWRLGKKDEARAQLKEGNRLAPPSMPRHIAENTSNEEWVAWLYARIQLDEATALIEMP